MSVGTLKLYACVGITSVPFKSITSISIISLSSKCMHNYKGSVREQINATF